MELAGHVDAIPATQPSVLAGLRLQRKLTVEEAAKRAALWPDQVEDRVRRPRHRHLALYDLGNILLLGGIILFPYGKLSWRIAGLLALLPILMLLHGTLYQAFFVGFGHGSTQAGKSAALPPPWKYTTDILNGSGDINYTRQLASHVGSFGYQIGHVMKANRFGYKQTVIYFEPGGEAAARRLASQLGCGTVSPLPGGHDPRRLVVIAGPPSATC